MSEDEQHSLDDDINQFQSQLLGEIPEILSHIPSDALRQQVYGIAFKANDVLPKRHSRPQMVAAYLVQQLCVAYELDAKLLSHLIRFTVSTQEYFDMLDDVVDGDVESGNIAPVIMVSQSLMPIMLKELNKLGPQAVDYWAECTLRLLDALYLEKCSEPSGDNFLRALDAQSWLYGACTGLVAVAAGRTEAVSLAESIGCAAYRYSKLFLDLDQSRNALNEPWCSSHFFSAERVRALISNEHQTLCSALENLPFPRVASNIRALFSVNVGSSV